MLPATAGLGKPVRLSARSAAGPTVVVTVAVLLAGMGSTWRAFAVAVAAISPSAAGTTAIVAVAVAAAAKLGKLQKITLPAKVAVPVEKVAETMGALAGKTFVTVIAVAGLGPLFVNETV